MSNMEVLKKGAQELRIVSEPITSERLQDPQIQTLIDNMMETMEKERGVGIAAPQVGVNERIIIVDDGKNINAYIKQ